MEPEGIAARRATFDDLEQLRELWAAAGQPADQLGELLGEFHVAEAAGGALAGAVGLMLEGGEALLHTETIGDEFGDRARAALWRRITILAKHQGVRRVWTQEEAPFWEAQGFASAEGQRPAFGAESDSWRRVDFITPDQQALLTEQLAIWRSERLDAAERLRGQKSLARTAAILSAALVVGGALASLAYVAFRRPELLRRLLGGQ